MPEAAPANAEVNEFQKAVAATYGNGDFAYVNEITDHAEYIKAVKETGDGLFSFLIVELSNKEDCVTAEDARNRLDTVARQIAEAVQAVDDVEMNNDPSYGG